MDKTQADRFAAEIARFVTANQLISSGAQVLVAVSGGPDSCALLLALQEAINAGLLYASLCAAHFHHGLREADADEDAAFCAGLCATLSVPCTIGIGAVPKRGNTSPNASARQSRYAFLTEVAAERGATHLATAHTADDQAETVLLRVLRGTSINGLAGIPVRRTLESNLQIVRPLLGMRRAAVEEYCRARGIEPRHDPSNTNPRYARSRLRSRLPDLARDFNPALTTTLNRLAAHAARDADLLETLTNDLEKRARIAGAVVCLSLPILQTAHPALRGRVLLRALRDAAGDHDRETLETTEWVTYLETLVAGPNTPERPLPAGLRARIDGTVLQLWRYEEEVSSTLPRPVPLLLPGQAEIPETGQLIIATWLERSASPIRTRRSPVVDIAAPRASNDTIESESGEAFAVAPCMVRPVQSGDRMAPLGMAGKTRLIHDILAEAGVPQKERDRQLLVCRVDTGEVLWLVGFVQSESTRVTPETENVIRLRLQPVSREDSPLPVPNTLKPTANTFP